MAIRNAWVKYRREYFCFYNGPGDGDNDAPPKYLNLFEFIHDVAKGILIQAAIDRGNNRRRTVEMPDSIRYDRIDHWPISITVKRGRCPVCASKGNRSEPNTYCEKCKEALCCTKGKTCFRDFHTK